MQKLARSVLPGLLFMSQLFTAKSAWAAAGSLDPTFGSGGVTVTTLVTAGQNSGVIPYSVKLQPDGKILILLNAINGPSATEVLRYTSTGALDATFGTDGIAVVPTAMSTFETMALESDGQVVIAGEVTDPATGAAAFGVQRLNSNGSPDTTFGKDGLAVASLGFPGTQGVLLIQPNGDILFGGQLEPVGRRQPFHTALARFTSTGAPDVTFGNGGTVNVSAVGGCTALALLSSGEIQVVDAHAIAQFTSNGVLEPTATGGLLVESAGSGAPSTASAFQPNGDYLLGDMLFVGLESRGHNASAQVLRFTSTGIPDSTFANPSFHFVGAGGSGIEATPNAIAVQSNGDIMVVGEQSTITSAGTVIVNGLARLTPTGSLDPTFGSNGTVANSIPSGTQGLSGVAIQPTDGRIVTIGTANNYTQLVVSRYLAQ